eukprot:8179732-Alexandrium_andersonii.AAC.1
MQFRQHPGTARSRLGQFRAPSRAFGRCRAASGVARNCPKALESARAHPNVAGTARKCQKMFGA